MFEVIVIELFLSKVRVYDSEISPSQRLEELGFGTWTS